MRDGNNPVDNDGDPVDYWSSVKDNAATPENMAVDQTLMVRFKISGFWDWGYDVRTPDIIARFICEYPPIPDVTIPPATTEPALPTTAVVINTTPGNVILIYVM